MYDKIVVPLDGSKLAECVLPHIEKLAKDKSVKEVVLVSVTERIAGYKPREKQAPVLGHAPIQSDFSLQALNMVPGADTGSSIYLSKTYSAIPVVVGKMEKQANRYLDRIATRLEKKKINVKTQVLVGYPAEQIASYAADAGADLILMASHGRSGIQRLTMGSVADKVFRLSSLPVLIVKCQVSA